MTLFRFLKNRISNLRKLWYIEIIYPRHYAIGKIKSLIPSFLLNNSKGLFIEENVHIKNPHIKIGKHTYIGNNTIIDACESIGAFCSISSDVKIGMRDHPLSYLSTSPIFYSKYRDWVAETTFDDGNNKTVVIEDDVLISANVIILNGVKIGRGAVIAAGAVVNKDVEPYSIVGGVPAKKLKMRFEKEVIVLLEKSTWWLKPDEELKKCMIYSHSPLEFIKALEN